MPKLCVEYSKSGRAKCSLTSCGKKIEKNELRVGTEVILPYSDEGVETWKWRHLCCFTERQLANARSSNALDDILGEKDLAPADQVLVQKMRDGELIGDTSIIGRIGNIANPPLAKELKGKKAGKVGEVSASAAAAAADASPGEKRPRAPRKAKATAATKADEDVDSEATDEYEVAVEAVSAKPRCPYGADCFRTNPEHFAQYLHNTDAAEGAVTGGAVETTMKPVIKHKK